MPRLRIYPHALREANAYLQPATRRRCSSATFRASATDTAQRCRAARCSPACRTTSSRTRPRTRCSTDCIAASSEPTNPDVLAFHEAFADIVALFQHFTFPGGAEAPDRATRGDLASENLLGAARVQFGEATGMHGALRDAIGASTRTPAMESRPARARGFTDDRRAARTRRHPRRGRLRRFLHIYRHAPPICSASRPTAPASCPPANLPDLVDRLAGEAAKVARHVLNMCIRALDYCPPVDLTFGDYLRALITADATWSRDDDRGYRVAFIAAFRDRGIYPPRRASRRGQPGLGAAAPSDPEVDHNLLIGFKKLVEQSSISNGA